MLPQSTLLHVQRGLEVSSTIFLIFFTSVTPRERDSGEGVVQRVLHEKKQSRLPSRKRRQAADKYRHSWGWAGLDWAGARRAASSGVLLLRDLMLGSLAYQNVGQQRDFTQGDVSSYSLDTRH